MYPVHAQIILNMRSCLHCLHINVSCVHNSLHILLYRRNIKHQYTGGQERSRPIFLTSTTLIDLTTTSTGSTIVSLRISSWPFVLGLRAWHLNPSVSKLSGYVYFYCLFFFYTSAVTLYLFRSKVSACELLSCVCCSVT